MELFFGAFILIFLIRCAGLVFNNFAETVFLKRFGVSYLPLLYIINPIITIFLLGKLATMKHDISAYGRLLLILGSCAVISAGMWGMLFFEITMLYPLLMIMRVQFEIVLSVFFWNLGNDLFNFHQSKRLFPLLAAGGVFGDIGGNLLTILFSSTASIDHLMLVYGAVLIFALLITRYLGERFPLQVVSLVSRSSDKYKAGLLSRLRSFRPLMKKSSLIVVMVFLTFFANIVLPIMNYQFNVVVDQRFTGEDSMIFFFGSFRGVMNGVSLILLFFSNRFYGRWGIHTALLFHPLNYLLVFLGFLFRFDLVSAMYARFSTNVIRTTFNQPVNNMIIGIFPDEYREKIRPFLRGIVARAGLITGALLVFMTTAVIPASCLSYIALPFVLCWIATVVFLKWKYSSLIIQLLSSDTLDLKSIEAHVVRKIFYKKPIRRKLVEVLFWS
ncbi:MAG: Npt1/Npt2 family nucleotide transporter [Desulfobacteraceae bacterium]